MRKPTYAVRYSQNQPAERIFPTPPYCPDISVAPEMVLPLRKGRLGVMVWNIFKQQRLRWLNVLQENARHAQLLLLQEAQSTPELINFATRYYHSADQVPAIHLPQHTSGVMTIAATQPLYCCPLRAREPLLRLSKSALITVYALPDGRMLMVVNIHAINFSLGVDVYSKQLLPVGEFILRHNGPVLMAGDFNTWSRPRVNALYRFARRLKLSQVRFSHDVRRRAFGRPLDFVFYRGLKVHSSAVLPTHASDHNPLLVEFSYEETALSADSACKWHLDTH